MRFLMAGAYLRKHVLTPHLAARYAGFARAPGARWALIEHARAYDADKAALWPRLGQVGMPTPVVWTDRDPFFPLGIGQRLLVAVPSARLEVIPDAGHLLQEEQPAGFSRVVLDWLDETTGQPAPLTRSWGTKMIPVGAPRAPSGPLGHGPHGDRQTP